MDVLARMQEAVASGPMELSPLHWQSPLAVVCPTTPETRTAAGALQDRGVAVVVGDSGQEACSAGTVLRSLAADPGYRRDLILFSDQLVGPADASVLVRTDEQAVYLSALEAVLSMKYGYSLAIWNAQGFRLFESGHGDIEAVFRCMALYLRECLSLGADWQANNLQHLRSPAERTAAALRKLRHFRSSVISALVECEDDPEGLALLGAVGELERRVAAASAI